MDVRELITKWQKNNTVSLSLIKRGSFSIFQQAQFLFIHPFGLNNRISLSKVPIINSPYESGHLVSRVYYVYHRNKKKGEMFDIDEKIKDVISLSLSIAKKIKTILPMSFNHSQRLYQFGKDKGLVDAYIEEINGEFAMVPLINYAELGKYVIPLPNMILSDSDAAVLRSPLKSDLLLYESEFYKKITSDYERALVVSLAKQYDFMHRDSNKRMVLFRRNVDVLVSILREMRNLLDVEYVNLPYLKSPYNVRIEKMVNTTMPPPPFYVEEFEYVYKHRRNILQEITSNDLIKSMQEQFLLRDLSAQIHRERTHKRGSDEHTNL